MTKAVWEDIICENCFIVIDELARSTGYDVDFLQELFWEMIDDLDDISEFGEAWESFVCITLELDW